jgi:hypothetical protein
MMEAQKKEEEELKRKFQANQAEKIQQKKLPVIQEQQVEIKPEMANEVKNVNMTLDGLRGLYLIASGIGDKKANKTALEQKLKAELLTPAGFGSFMENLAKYLKSV